MTWYISKNKLAGIFLLSFLSVIIFYTYSNASAATDPTVSTSPPGGPYNATQSVTLTASTTSSTIYYTTNGTTPTISSTNGPSPVTIIVNTTSTLKYFAKDNSGNIGPTGSASYTITIPTVTPMNDTSGISGLSVYSGRQLQTEYITSSSVLNGKSIDTITVFLKKIGAPTGTVQVGVFNSDQSVKQLFGTKDASTVATSYTQYTFSLTAPQIYKIQSGDRIGVKFTGGDATTNYLAIRIDPSNTFDGTNSFLTYYTTGWQVFTANDLNMVLKLHLYGTGPTVSASPGPGTYGSAQSVTLTASAPSTIYYTTDGSVPTVSSTNGPSPVSGITINTNSTLKFFAKDSSGNTGPVVTAVYTIIPPPTVSASPPGGTYNSIQSVTLTASRSGTIYYTTDGSVPTVSSPNGPSPVSGITINTNSTLKFFAKDNFGISGSIDSAVYTIISPLTVSASPGPGTYNSTQSVNLTASTPSTIYYTT